MSDEEKKETAASGSENASGEDEKDKSDSKMDFLREYLSRSLGLREKPEQILEELSLAGIAKYINSDKCKNIVTMAGAGISTSAGIPDFRSPGTGLYNNLASYNLPYPQAIFELNFFKENPRPFFVLAKELMPGSFKPTPCHYFIKLLDFKKKLKRHYTQNIDTLERVAGLDGDKIVEAHGSFHTSHCLECNKDFTFPWMKERILDGKIPKCDVEGCKGVVKPDIVFFGERLPDRFVQLVDEDLSDCDLLIVMGTSLTVQPFASLVNRVGFDTPRLYINLEKGMTAKNPISALMFGGGFEFDSEDNYRDVFKEATCDDGCQELADLLGIGDMLKEHVEKAHGFIDREGNGASGKTSAPASGETKKSSPKPASATGVSKTPSPKSASASSETKKSSSKSASSVTGETKKSSPKSASATANKSRKSDPGSAKSKLS